MEPISDGRGAFRCCVQNWTPHASNLDKDGSRPLSAYPRSGGDSSSDDFIHRPEPRRQAQSAAWQQRREDEEHDRDVQQQHVLPLRTAPPVHAKGRHGRSPGSSFDSTNDGLNGLWEAAQFVGMYGGAHSPAKASCHSTDSMHDHGAEPEYETTPSSRHKRRLPSPLHRHAQSMPTIRSLPNLGSDHEAEEVEERLGTPSPPVSRNRSPHLPPPLKRRQSTPSSNFDPKPNLSRRQPSVGRVSRKSSVADEDESWSDCMEEDEAETEIDEEAPPRSRARSGSQSSRQERLGHWTPEEKQQLLELVHHKDPCGAADWEAIATALNRFSKGGASAERMYRTLTDPEYKKSTNKHGRRLNSRKGTPMHIMAAFALRMLPNHRGNLTKIAEHIEAYEVFREQLDFTARPGTKTYPRWKDALLGCFKAGRYKHLSNSGSKEAGLNVYSLYASKMPTDVAATVNKAVADHKKTLGDLNKDVAQDVAGASPAASSEHEHAAQQTAAVRDAGNSHASGTPAAQGHANSVQDVEMHAERHAEGPIAKVQTPELDTKDEE